MDARSEAKTAGEREIAAVRDNFEQEKRKARETLRSQIADLVFRARKKSLAAKSRPMTTNAC